MAVMCAAGSVVSGSGVVTKWMQDKGLLVTGGSSDRIRVWDMRKEQIVSHAPLPPSLPTSTQQRA